jgi:hypothetical protein
VLRRQSPTADRDRPVQPGPTRVEQAALPGDGLVDETGRNDRAVIGRRFLAVGVDPPDHVAPEAFEFAVVHMGTVDAAFSFFCSASLR